MTILTSGSVTTSTVKDRHAGAAILGYVYQFDLTVLSILGADDKDVITVEGLEDVDLHSASGLTATQVKYHSQARYASPVSLRKPVKLMLESFASGIECNYILHVYFGEGTPPQAFTVEQLKKCLTETKRNPPGTFRYYEAYDNKVLENFVERLQIRPGREHKDQQAQLINRLADALSCHEDEAKYLHYGNALTKIQNLAMEADLSARRVTRSKFLEEINKRSTLYSRWHRELLGDARYVKALREKIRATNTLWRTRDRAVVLGVNDHPNRIREIAGFIANLSMRDHVGRRCLTDTKPWTVVLEGDDKNVRLVKKYLLDLEIAISDGFEEIEFNSTIYARNPVINAKGAYITNRSFDIRVIRAKSFHSYYCGNRKIGAIVVTTNDENRIYDKSSILPCISVEGLDLHHLSKLLEVSK